MLQRVQTIYLVLAFACIVGVLFLPTFSVVSGNESHNIYIGAGMLSKIILVIMALFPAAAIMLYKNRPMQLKICRLGLINYILAALIFVLIALFGQNYMVEPFIEAGLISESTEFAFGFGLGYYIMFISVAFMLLAIRGIRADEKLVKSLDRLR